MIRRLAFAIAAVVALAGSPPAGVAQETAPVVEAPAGMDVAAQTGEAEMGLPLREPPPRTLRAYWHVFIAFAVTWVLLFGYALTVGRRFGKLEEELRRLRG